MGELKTDPTPAAATLTRRTDPQTQAVGTPVEQESRPHQPQTGADAVTVRPHRRRPLRTGLQTGLQTGLAR